MKKTNSLKKALFTLVTLFGLTVASIAFAAQGTENLGEVSEEVTGSFKGVTYLLTAGSYIAGLAFTISAILKFKQHKDNPTQIPIGTPIALAFIAAVLLFLPSTLGVTGKTMFGDPQTAGPEGTIFSENPVNVK